MNKIIEATFFSLQQLEEFLQQLSQEEYTRSLQVYSNSTIGMHTRHVLEFYQCLLSSSEMNEINYDSRKRNLRLETDIECALKIAQEIKQQLVYIKNKPLTLKMDISMDDKDISVATNIERELVYLLEHTIHHLAILKMGCIVAFPAVHLHANFGVAYSTLKHRNTCVQ